MDITQILLSWYEQNKRDLPWRETRDPYKIWLSEVILQQTRVNQGMEYYLRFVERFPDVQSLAAAGEEEVLKLWQGLGYYSRARNLHHAAMTVKKEYGGTFPSHYNELLALKGIGEYTAAAIASIASGEVVPVVDGNVSRVLSRLYAVEAAVDSTEGARLIRGIAGELITSKDPATFNQALMEFGALQCKPGVPDCGACPLQQHCLAFRQKKVQSFPVKKPKIPPKELFLYYLHVRFTSEGKSFILLRKRSDQGIWKNLYDFPCIESPSELSIEQVLQDKNVRHLIGLNPPSGILVSYEYIHKLSHRTFRARFIEIRLNSQPVQSNYVKVAPDDLPAYPVPRLIDLYLQGPGCAKNDIHVKSRG